jgi:hypothetical protein
MMDATEYLERYKKIDAVIMNKLDQHRRWVQIAEGLGGASTGERVQASRKLDQIPNAIVNYIYIEQEIAALKREQEGIIKTLERLPREEYETLYILYIKDGDNSLKDVAYHLRKSYETAKRYKQMGIEKIEKIIQK